MRRIRDIKREEVPFLPYMDLKKPPKNKEDIRAFLTHLHTGDNAKIFLRMRKPISVEEWDALEQSWGRHSRCLIQSVSCVWEWDDELLCLERLVDPWVGIFHTSGEYICLRTFWKEKAKIRFSELEKRMGETFSSLKAVAFNACNFPSHLDGDFTEIEQLLNLLRWFQKNQWLSGIETLTCKGYSFRSRTQFEKFLKLLLENTPKLSYLALDVTLRERKHHKIQASVARMLPNDFEIYDGREGLHCYSRTRMKTATEMKKDVLYSR